MNDRSGRLQLPAFAAALILSGCTNMSDPSSQQHRFNTQQSAAEARAQIGQWIKPGTALADAIARMRSEGFDCREIQADTAGVAHSTLCTTATANGATGESKVVAPLTPVNWFVTLDSSDGRVLSGVEVARSPKDIAG